jgi:Uma2 family endonuclease
MSIAARPVRYDFDDYVLYTETHPDDSFELIDGVIYKLAPEGDPHFLTRSGLYMYLAKMLNLAKYTPWSEGSFRAPGWADGPRPDAFISRGPGLVDGRFSKRPTAENIALVIEVSSTSRIKDRKKAKVYARLDIPEYWMIDLIAGVVVVHRDPAMRNEGPEYESVTEFARNATIASQAVDGLAIETDFLLQLAD